MNGIERQYLVLIPFDIFTDHKSLTSIESVGAQNPRVQRWIDFLAPYGYTLTYRKDIRNGNADLLSRLPQKPTDADFSPDCQLAHLDDYAVYFLGASGCWPKISAGSQGPIVGGLLPPTPVVSLGGLLHPPDYYYDAVKEQYLYHGSREITKQIGRRVSFSCHKFRSELIAQHGLAVLGRTRAQTAAMVSSRETHAASTTFSVGNYTPNR